MIKDLNKEQKQALKTLLNTKHNVFLTGEAGTGKSYVIKMFREIKGLQGEKIPMVASTGAASLLINGVTFNSYFGLGIMTGGSENTIKNALTSRTVVERIIYTDTIIIDEISMISNEVFMTANKLCQKIRQNKKFFGGIRVVCVGDFFQLGPFSDDEKPDWVFEGKTWKEGKLKKISLKQVMRTKDKKFLQVLSKIRYGKITKDVLAFLDKKKIKGKVKDNSIPHIFPRIKEVDLFNSLKLKELTGNMFISKTMYVGDPSSVEKMKEGLVIPDVLEIKKGALVMTRVNNFQDGYVNGTVGVVIGISTDVLTIKKDNGEVIQVKKHIFELLNGNGEVVAKARNFPCILAWAITIQKSQGCSIDKAIISLDRLWLHGQAYTALSRLSSEKGLFIQTYQKNSFIVDKKVLKYNKS